METILSHTEHTPNEFLRLLSQRSNFDSFYMDIRTHAVHMPKRFHRMLSIQAFEHTYLDKFEIYESVDGLLKNIIMISFDLA